MFIMRNSKLFSTSNRNDCHHDVPEWVFEYAHYCASNDNKVCGCVADIEDDDDDDQPGYITTYDMTDLVTAERRAFALMGSLEELRDRTIRGWHFEYSLEGSPMVTIEFEDADLMGEPTGTGVHIFRAG